MSIASQLFHLQAVDTELESDVQAVTGITRRLGDRSPITEAENRLAAERKKLEELTRQQRSTEWEAEDLASKIATIEQQLYGGRVRNPKELTDLQQEANALKARHAILEDKALETMEQVELATGTTSELEGQLKKLEAQWQAEQKQLSEEKERLQAAIATLKEERESLAAGIDPEAMAIYQDMKKKRGGTAVTRVEQGLCRGCRIMLPVTDFQRLRTGALVRCGSCGRILFLS